MKIKVIVDFHLILLDDLLETTTTTTGKKKKKVDVIPKQDNCHLSKSDFSSYLQIPGLVLVSLEDRSPRWTDRIFCAWMYLLYRILKSSVCSRTEQRSLTNTNPNIFLRHSVEYLVSGITPRISRDSKEPYMLTKTLGKTRVSWTIWTRWSPSCIYGKELEQTQSLWLSRKDSIFHKNVIFCMVGHQLFFGWSFSFCQVI